MLLSKNNIFQKVDGLTNYGTFYEDLLHILIENGFSVSDPMQQDIYIICTYAGERYKELQRKAFRKMELV